MYEQMSWNRRKSFALCAFFVILIFILALLFEEVAPGARIIALPLAIIFATLGPLVGYYNSDKIILKMSAARPATREEHLFLQNTVEGLAIAAGIPTPKLYVIEDTAPNAFATGRNPEHGVIAVTTGLLQKLNRREIEGVLAHEMSHIKNYDTLLGSLAVVLVGVVALLSDWMLRNFWRTSRGRRRAGRSGGRGGQAQAIVLVLAIIMAILAPIIAQLLRLAVSRRRELLADAHGAFLTRYPDGLASALEKLDADTEPLEVANKSTAHLYIVNPLREHAGLLNNLFSTHPSTRERIAALRAM
ncbi:MAG: M48 family metallopeptidase [Chitinivibrionia bacterium]|nr:M48 family metallopeptidase [Chitinivibrionia bacterium]